jgi:hypothetical protein
MDKNVQIVLAVVAVVVVVAIGVMFMMRPSGGSDGAATNAQNAPTPMVPSNEPGGAMVPAPGFETATPVPAGGAPK